MLDKTLMKKIFQRLKNAILVLIFVWQYSKYKLNIKIVITKKMIFFAKTGKAKKCYFIVNKLIQVHFIAKL